jgi:hypothetical protein
MLTEKQLRRYQPRLAGGGAEMQRLVSRQGGRIDAGIDNHPTIPANDDHHLPTRRCGSNGRLDLSGKDDPRKAGWANRLGTERAPPCHQQRT